MKTVLDGTSLQPIEIMGSSSLYKLHIPHLHNNYYLLSGKGSRALEAFPEVVGFPCYTALLDEMVDSFNYLRSLGLGEQIDLFTILRGGLNYPLEEAAYRCGMRVHEINFVSCERVIEDHVIKGLEIKYDKIRPSKGSVMAIGDILATGDTFRYCFSHMLNQFREAKGSIRRIIFFTIGGTRAFDLIESMAEELKSLFPGFQGIDCFFFEGAFTVYEDKGVSGINVPNIDFGWKGGIVTPEFRRYIVDNPDALLEKCIIYDGGARRYEIPIHFDEVLEYWEGIRERAGLIDVRALVEEKLGYAGPVDYEKWLDITHLRGLQGLEKLWADEQALLERRVDLGALAERRIASIYNLKKSYEKD